MQQEKNRKILTYFIIPLVIIACIFIPKNAWQKLFSLNFNKIASVYSAVPKVSTFNRLSTINADSAYLLGEVTSVGSSNLIERGFYYGPHGQNASSTITDFGQIGTGFFAMPISELFCGTTYDYKAYAKNNDGEGYGNLESFTTKDCPLPENLAVTEIKNTGTSTFIILPKNIIGTSFAVLYGVISTSSKNIIETGFNYGTSFERLNKNVSTTTNLSTGVYYLEISGLSCDTDYFYQAYAKNSAGEGDGAIQNFKTLSCK